MQKRSEVTTISHMSAEIIVTNQFEPDFLGRFSPNETDQVVRLEDENKTPYAHYQISHTGENVAVLGLEATLDAEGLTIHGCLNQKILSPYEVIIDTFVNHSVIISNIPKNSDSTQETV